MTLSEKSAYLKGLMEGLRIDTDKADGKMISAIVDMLDDVAQAIGSLEETTIAISDELDDIEDNLDEIDDILMDFEEEEESLDDEEDDEEDYDLGDNIIYEVECGKCGEIVNFDDEVLEKGSIVCPNCGELLEFSADDIEEEL